MLTKRVALVARDPKQRPAPKPREFRKVLRPVDVGDVVEHRPKDIVLRHVGVETTHQFLHIFGGDNIAGGLQTPDDRLDDHISTLQCK